MAITEQTTEAAPDSGLILQLGADLTAQLEAMEARLAGQLIMLGQAVAGLSTRLANIEGKIADYEPLIDMVRERAERPSWRNRFAQGGSDGR